MANSTPIFVKNNRVEWDSAGGVIATANTAKDGTGTVKTVFTADATNGSFVQKLIIRGAGTNIATVLRVFVNNGSANSTPANNILIAEISLAPTTLNEAGSLQDYQLPLNFGLNPGYKLNITIGTTVSAGYFVSAIGGDY